MEVVPPSPRRFEPTVQVPRSRARRTRLRLALTAAVAFAASLAGGIIAMETANASPGRLVEPQARVAVRIAPKTLEVNEPAAVTRLVAMERHRSARRR